MKDFVAVPKMKGVLKRSLDVAKARQLSIPKASSFQLLLKHLEDGQIQEVRLGFHESCLTMEDYAKLWKVLRQNTSLVKVELGWDIPRLALLKLLDSVARLPVLTSLSLTIYANLPARLLRRLVSKPTLQHLELRNVAVGPNPWKERIILTATGKLAHTGEGNQNVSFLSGDFSDSIESLHIVSCDLDIEDIKRFCDWTNRRKVPLKEFGFEFCSSMTPGCLEILCQQANCKRLDLTACGLNDEDATVLATNLPLSNTIEQLVVARNPLLGMSIDSTPLEHFLQVAFQQLISLDISGCHLSKDQVDAILQRLADDSRCSLESLSMLGIPKDYDPDQVFLRHILRNNSVLRSLHIQPTTDLVREPILSKESLSRIERSLAENYTIETLQVGRTSLVMDLLLDLNRAGRSLLRDEPNAPADWARVLSRASHRPDAVFWLLQHGVDRIVQHNDLN